MGGYSYKKRNKAVKQSFKNRRSSPRNINIMIGGEEPSGFNDEEPEMVGGAPEDIKKGFDAIDNYFKTAFIPKDVNTVYIEKAGSGVEVLTRATTPGAAVNPTTTTPTAGAGATKPTVNTNANIALSIANVIQKAFDVLPTVGPNTTQQPSNTITKKKQATAEPTQAAPTQAAPTQAAAAAAAAATQVAAKIKVADKNQFVQPEVVYVINATMAVIQHGVNTTALNNFTTALNQLSVALDEIPTTAAP